MKIERVILLALMFGCAVYAVDVVRTRIGTGKPGAGQLQPGETATDTNAMNLYVGNSASQAVLVGSAEWTNLVSATGVTTNLSLWTGTTNAVLCITNGSIKGVTTP